MLVSSEVSDAGSKKRTRDGTKNRGSSGADSAPGATGAPGPETGELCCAVGEKSAGCEISVWSG